MVQPALPGRIEAQIHGQTGGQVAVGNYIVQIGSIHGGVVNILQPGQQPTVQPRSTPIQLRPRALRGMLDRTAEISTAESAFRNDLPVEFS